jgi:hypothetical protein
MDVIIGLSLNSTRAEMELEDSNRKFGYGANYTTCPSFFCSP